MYVISGYCDGRGVLKKSKISTKMMITFGDHVKRVTSNINDGTQIMKEMSESIKHTNFDTIGKTDEKNLVRKLQQHF